MGSLQQGLRVTFDLSTYKDTVVLQTESQPQKAKEHNGTCNPSTLKAEAGRQPYTGLSLVSSQCSVPARATV